MHYDDHLWMLNDESINPNIFIRDICSHSFTLSMKVFVIHIIYLSIEKSI